MRPCDQCRKPVENSQQICDDCEQGNRTRGVKHKPSVSIAPIDPTKAPPVAWDQSINMMAVSLLICMVVVMGGTGFLMFGLRGLLIGSLLALFSPMLLSPFFR